MELEGNVIPEASWVDLWIGAAHRDDPAAFPDPDRLDVGGRGARHLAFGDGGHYCLGAPLARLEAAIAFCQLIELPLELDGEPRWHDNPVLRGLSTLVLRLAGR